MPTFDNPTHYERASGIATGREDVFFKSLSPDDSIDDSGSTESPYGYVMLVQLDPWMLNDLMRENDLLDPSDVPTPGWYIVRHDDHGLVWGIWYGGWCNEHGAFCEDTYAEERARADWNEVLQLTIDWHDDQFV